MKGNFEILKSNNEPYDFRVTAFELTLING